MYKDKKREYYNIIYIGIKKGESMKFNDYLLADIDCYIYPPTNGDKVYNWGC